ncbi:hypothetical protein AAVH_09230 [Aphelenchoides avenae]|nr:hypothetical protein AAVH_09230 [Aphelenchus avenae]
MLLDFCYYFVLRIFDENSDERFKRENPNHRYFKAYTRISDANTCILKSVLVSFQFKDDFMTVVCAAKAWGVMQLQGNSYDPKTYKYLPKEQQSPEKPKFVLCKLHGTIASVCFNLAQMSWSLNCNVEFRVKHVLQRHSNYTAEQVIDAIDPDVFKKLAAYYLKFFVELDSYGSVNKSSSRKQRDLTKQCLAWIRVVQRWKERAMRINRA